MHQNNVFTVAKRTLEGQDMIYQSIKFTNNVWALCELKLQPNNPVITVRSLFLDMHNFTDFLNIFFTFQLAIKSRAVDVAQGVYNAYEAILRN